MTRIVRRRAVKPTTEFRVRLKNIDTELVVPQNSSMLDALNGAGFEVISDCQRGECGVCAIDVVAIEGEIDHRDVFFSDQQKRDNRKICPCVSRAIGVVTIDTLYRPEAAQRKAHFRNGPPLVMAGLVPAIHVFPAVLKQRRGCPAQGRA